jgi:hypothetical protein
MIGTSLLSGLLSHFSRMPEWPGQYLEMDFDSLQPHSSILAFIIFGFHSMVDKFNLYRMSAYSISNLKIMITMIIK